jgi:FkbM family methyltransferase
VSTYFLSQAVGPTGKVFAFEPDPIAWESLTHNIGALNMRNVHPVQKAVAGKAGQLKCIRLSIAPWCADGFSGALE